MLESILIRLEAIFTANYFSGLTASFTAGILTSFSPCIYPLIPITLGILGRASVSGRLQGFLASFVFVLGVSVIYTAMGMTSSLMGIFVGAIFVNPLIYFILFVVFLLLGLSALDILKISIPLLNFNYSGDKSKSLFSIFVLGMVSGFAIIPCNFPVLGAILGLISLKRNVIYGGLCLFLFSLGYGLVLIILGTFTGLIQRLPKYGLWIIIIKRLSGLLIIAMSLYFFKKFIDIIL